MVLTSKQFETLRQEIEQLAYLKPRCDFEHAWNCALDKVDDCFNGWEGDE